MGLYGVLWRVYGSVQGLVGSGIRAIESLLGTRSVFGPATC